MSTFKKCKVLLLPTNEKASIYLKCYIHKLNKLILGTNIAKESTSSIKDLEDKSYKAQHLYILSDDEIEERDFDKLLKQGLYFESSNEMIKIITTNRIKTPGFYKKIIATTNTSLTVKAEKAGENTWHNPLPQPSIQFIQKYTEEYNKGNIIKDVLVEYEWIDNPEQIPGVGDYWDLKIHPKDNTITIKKVKDSWNREEIVELLKKHSDYIDSKIDYDAINNACCSIPTPSWDDDKWIENNL